MRRSAHITQCRHSGCNGTASSACHEPLLPMRPRSFCNRLTQQALVTCCPAGRAPPTVGHSRISSRNFDSINSVRSELGLLSRRRQKKVAKLVFVRSASTDLVFILEIYALLQGLRRQHFVRKCENYFAVYDCSQLDCWRLLPQRLYSPASGSTTRLKLISAATCSDC